MPLPSNNRGNVNKPLPSNDRRDIRSHTDGWERFMKYVVEMGTAAMIYIYIPSFIKTGSGIRKIIRGIHRHTESMEIA
jgi:hypothetical protein